MKVCLALAMFLLSAPCLSAADESVTVTGTPVKVKSFLGQNKSLYGWIQIKQENGTYRLVYFPKSAYSQVTPAVQGYVQVLLQVATLGVKYGNITMTFANVKPSASAPAIAFFGWGSFGWYSLK